MRWDPAFQCRGLEFEPFWRQLAETPKSKRNGLLIAGRGIDPRTTIGPSALVNSGFPITTCLLLQLTLPFDNPNRPRNRAAAANESIMRDLFGNVNFDLEEVPVLNENGRPISFHHLRNVFVDSGWLAKFTDVIVDISAFPTSVSYPLLAILIGISDSLFQTNPSSFNLHCIVCESPEVDAMVVSEGGDVAEYIVPFSGGLSLAGDSDPITIWAPVLGEGQAAVLEKIYSTLAPAEVKPFLPAPSRRPRRGDELVSEYSSLLFGTWGVDPRGFIYANESDPFDIYRQISGLAKDYADSLAPLGKAYTVLSTHASKLLSLGVFLAAWENKLAVTHVEPTGYELRQPGAEAVTSELFEIWLTGEAYEP